MSKSSDAVYREVVKYLKEKLTSETYNAYLYRRINIGPDRIPLKGNLYKYRWLDGCYMLASNRNNKGSYPIEEEDDKHEEQK